MNETVKLGALLKGITVNIDSSDDEERHSSKLILDSADEFLSLHSYN